MRNVIQKIELTIKEFEGYKQAEPNQGKKMIISLFINHLQDIRNMVIDNIGKPNTPEPEQNNTQIDEAGPGEVNSTKDMGLLGRLFG